MTRLSNRNRKTPLTYSGPIYIKSSYLHALYIAKTLNRERTDQTGLAGVILVQAGPEHPDHGARTRPGRAYRGGMFEPGRLQQPRAVEPGEVNAEPGEVNQQMTPGTAPDPHESPAARPLKKPPLERIKPDERKNPVPCHSAQARNHRL